MEHDGTQEQSRIKDIPGHVKDFIKTKVAYYKLAAYETGGNVAAGAITGILLFLFGLFFLIFLSITLAVLIGESIGHLWIGFLIITGFYLLLIGIVLVFKDQLIKTPIMNAILRNALPPNTSPDEVSKNNYNDKKI